MILLSLDVIVDCIFVKRHARCGEENCDMCGAQPEAPNESQRDLKRVIILNVDRIKKWFSDDIFTKKHNFGVLLA